MTKTGTQNRPYTSERLMVRATFYWPKGEGRSGHQTEFDWNNREAVRSFAASSDRCIRVGGSTTLEAM